MAAEVAVATAAAVMAVAAVVAAAPAAVLSFLPGPTFLLFPVNFGRQKFGF